VIDTICDATYLRHSASLCIPLCIDPPGAHVRFPTRDIPVRVASGAFILHSGLQKWRGTEEVAEGVHGTATGAFPFLRSVAPTTFLKAVAVAEIGVGAALLAPVVPNRLAGASLTAFAGSLVAMYLRLPGVRQPGSIWPTPAGIGLSKDAWLLGIGLGLAADRSAAGQG
jgi:uncharacterized membrane protein YphA (DoxX/SURF4 family)